VQIGGKSRGGVGAQIVASAPVPGNALNQKPPHPAPARFLSSRWRSLGRLLESQVPQHRQLFLLGSAWKGRKGARRRHDLPAGPLQPGAMKRREHSIGVALRGEQFRGIVQHEQPRSDANIYVARLQRTPDGLIAPSGERTDVARPDDAARLELTRQIWEDLLGPTVAHDQPAAATTERLAEVFQALEQKLGARARSVAATEQTGVKAEHRHNSTTAI
jgi:hypothetical protein